MYKAGLRRRQMGFMAGYVSRQGAHESLLLEEQVKSYPILTGEAPDRYENRVIETKFGHIIQKYQRSYPMQSQPCQDVHGNLLVALGFLSTDHSLPSHEHLLACCVRDCANALEACEGEFVAIFVEGPSGTVHLVNDRFASRPFYVLQEDDHTYFSSNLDFLLYLAGGQHAIDVLGWLQMFSVGHTCGSRTTLRHVSRMRPGTHVTLSLQGLTERQYWRVAHTPETDLDPAAYSAQVFEAFQAGTAFRANLARKGILALSGGLDSRLVAAGLPKDVDFSAFTFVDSTDTSSTVQTQTAAEVCHVLGLNHRIQPLSRFEFSQVASPVIKLTGGLRPFHNMANAMLYVQAIRDKGFNFLLGGGPGDVIAGSKIPSLMYLDPKRVDECLSDFCRRHVLGSDVLALLFHQDIVQQYARDLHQSLVDSFENITGPTAAHRVTAWAMIHRWPAFTFTSVMHTHPEVTEAFCHLDYKFCDLMLKLPADWLYRRNFYAFMIYHNLPELRHIIYANTGKPLFGDLMQYNYKRTLSTLAMSFIGNIRRKVVHRNHFSRKLVRRIRSNTTRAAPQSFNYALFRNDEVLLTEMAECLGSYASLHEVLDAEKCQRFLGNFKAGRLQAQSYSQQTELLGSLATMCLSFRHLNLHIPPNFVVTS
jgi:Asparagine synthase